jgi:hypothetical protein
VVEWWNEGGISNFGPVVLSASQCMWFFFDCGKAVHMARNRTMASKMGRFSFPLEHDYNMNDFTV